MAYELLSVAHVSRCVHGSSHILSSPEQSCCFRMPFPFSIFHFLPTATAARFHFELQGSQDLLHCKKP